MPKGQSLTELKTSVLNKLVDDSKLVKALVIDSENFLYSTPTSEQNVIIQSPTQLIRKQIMPYRNITSVTNKAMPYITSAWVDFRKESNTYKNGKVYFYIIISNALEKTDYGIRYDYIADRIEAILKSNNNIGEFEFYEQGDIPVDSDNLGHYVAFKIVDFYGVDASV